MMKQMGGQLGLGPGRARQGQEGQEGQEGRREADAWRPDPAGDQNLPPRA